MLYTAFLLCATLDNRLMPILCDRQWIRQDSTPQFSTVTDISAFKLARRYSYVSHSGRCVVHWISFFSTTKPLVSKTPIATELLLRLQILSDQSLVIPKKPRIRLATPGRPQKCSTGLRCGCYFLPSQRRVWRAVANFICRH